MRSYLFLDNGDHTAKDSYTFDINAHYAKRLMKDVGLYEVSYVMYNSSSKRVTEFGQISCIEYYEKEKKGRVLFEDRKLLDTPFNFETKDYYGIIPLEAEDFKKMGIDTIK